MDSRDHLLILGGTTHENRGDLAMHAGLLRWLEKTRPDLEPVFLANNPEVTTRVLGVRGEPSPDAGLAQPWNKQTRESTWQRVRSCARGLRFLIGPGEFGRRLARAAAVWIPGSGSMNSQWWHDWLYVKAWEVSAARRAGVPVFATSQGVGPPFSHGLDARVARFLFNGCTVAGTRDGPASEQILRSCGVEPSRIHFTGDDSLLLEADDDGADRLLGGFGAGYPVIAINARDSSSYGRKYPKPDLGFWAALLGGLAALPAKPRLLFLPVSYDAADDDRRPARALVQSLLAAGVPAEHLLAPEDPFDAPVLRALAARATIGVGISYHFLLFCLSAGVPAFGLWQNPYYRAKIDGLMALHECPDHGLELGAVSPSELIGRINPLIESGNEARSRLESVTRRLRESAATTRKLILDSLPPPAPAASSARPG